MFGKCSVNVHLVNIEQMLVHGTVERGGVTETGPPHGDGGERGGVARGGSDGGERGPRGPVARPRASSLPVIIRGAAPEILTRHSSGEYSLCVAYSSMCVVLAFFMGSH